MGGETNNGLILGGEGIWFSFALNCFKPLSKNQESKINNKNVIQVNLFLSFHKRGAVNPLGPSITIQILSSHLHTVLTEVVVRKSREFNLSDHVLDSHDLPNQ